MHGKAVLSFLVVLVWGLQGQHGPSQPRSLDRAFSTKDGGNRMLQNYSQRAGLVLFFARGRAGSEGSRKVEVKHLLGAIVMEDQGVKNVETTLERVPVAGTIKGRGLESRSKPFFRPDVASELLVRLDAVASHAEPVATSLDLPVSAELEQILTAAEALRRDRQAHKVEPLDLLSAALADRSNRAAQLFLEAGITREMVLDTIKGK
jgi:hypothetical protein